jgi:predicted glycosyltransferase
MRIFAGTYTSSACWEELQLAASKTPGLEVHRWSADLGSELQRAACSVSRCGYNTALDVLASRVPALVVPFATPTEDEQTRRADRLAALNLVRTVAEEDLTPAGLAAEIRRTAAWTPSPHDIDFNGAARTAEWLLDRVAERRRSR